MKPKSNQKKVVKGFGIIDLSYGTLCNSTQTQSLEVYLTHREAVKNIFNKNPLEKVIPVEISYVLPIKAKKK